MAFPANVTRQQAEVDLIVKAMKDPKFRQNLLKDPKGAIQQVWGVQLPVDLKIVVHEEGAKELHLVLPDASSLHAVESMCETKVNAAKQAAAAAGPTHGICTLYECIGTGC